MKGNRFLQQVKFFTLFGKVLLDEMKTFYCDAHVYLFMPEHCHLLLQGKSDDADMLEMLKIFKQKTGYWLSHNRPDFKWQKDFTTIFFVRTKIFQNK